MKKVVLASLLAGCMFAPAYAQQAVSLGTGQAAAAANPCPPMQDAEYKAYTDATKATGAAQATAIEAYLTQFPQSCVKLPTLLALMQTYYGLQDVPKTLGTADRVLQLDATNYSALLLEAALRKATADSITDPAAKQAALDAASAAAQKGLTAPKSAGMSDDDFKKLQATGTPLFYSAIGAAALNKKDTAAAIDAYKKELASVPVAQTTMPAGQLPDTYSLGIAYLQSTPPDLLNCTFYMSRFVDYAPDPYKSQVAPTAKYCYRKYHGGDDGYDAVLTAAKSNLNPPADFSASIKPAPTPAEKIHAIIQSTPDLGTLATSDKELVFQYGSPDDAAKVWDTVKGKSFQFPDVLVIESSPTALKVAASEDAQQAKTADFTFNMAAPQDIPEPKATATQARSWPTRGQSPNRRRPRTRMPRLPQWGRRSRSAAPSTPILPTPS